jgi:hypothetical protein
MRKVWKENDESKLRDENWVVKNLISLRGVIWKESRRRMKNKREKNFLIRRRSCGKKSTLEHNKGNA